MLVYNYQKEFLGVDKRDLNILGFADLTSLKAEVDDFADLFVKTPGYIHNFQHVHWIDFITCAESNEKPKAIINANSKNFKCNLDVKIAYLIDNPSSEAYIISLMNLHQLSDEESELIAADIATKASQKASEVTHTQQPVTEVTPPHSVATPQQPKEEQQPLFQGELLNQQLDSFENDTLLDDDVKLDIQLDTPDDVFLNTQEPVEKIKTPSNQTPITPLQEEISDDEDDDYVYDPQVASAELGLPLDLIEEFIQDFILQAKEFKNELYASLEAEDIDNVKILSHKLKGVAANLRVENAFEVLTTINTSSDTSVIQKNLDRLYRIIAKLAGEEVPKVSSAPQQVTPQVAPSVVQTPAEDEKIEISFDEEVLETSPKISLDEDDMIEISFKDESTQEDEKIELPEFKEEVNTTTEPLQIEEDEKLEVPDLEIPELELQQESQKELQEESQKEIKKEVEEPVVHYSKEFAANEIGIAVETLEELLQDYKAEADSIFSNLQTAMENNDQETYNLELFKFKSMTENMRIKDLNELLQQLDNLQNKDELTPILKNMSAIIIQILK